MCPTRLAALAASEPERWEELKAALDDFGRESGLFEEVNIRRLGASASDRALFLLQQPEVHLHPRGLAALATLIGRIAKRNKSIVILETRSDFMLDRLRTDVRDRDDLEPSDVSIVFFEKTGREVALHQLEIDPLGNLLNVLASYRRFFMEEEERFLGIADSDEGG